MHWRLGDIVDLEYFLHRDIDSLSAGKHEQLHERDRNIYLSSVQPAIKESLKGDRRSILYIWLNQRRKERKDINVVLPGDIFNSVYGSLRWLFFIVGIVSGSGLAITFLAYTGDSPVNVFVYFSVFILSQLILLLFLVVLSLYRLYRKSSAPSSLLSGLINRLLRRMFVSAIDNVGQKLSADQRTKAESIIGTVLSKTRTYGIMFFLPPFMLTQLAGIGFNLGLIGATLFKIATTDIAFGWQSTIQLSASAVHELVQRIALPWSWAVAGDIAFPTLAQIEGSRIILKEGIYHLSTPDLVSWWPFLCFSVLVYGLLPRLILFTAAVFAKNRRLASHDFRQGSCEQLLQRMTTPQVSTRGCKVDDSALRNQENALDSSTQANRLEDENLIVKQLLVMIPDELYESSSREEIESVVSGIHDIMRINQNYASDRELLDTIGQLDMIHDADILLIQEAWQPPIMEYIEFIRQLRKSVGQGPCIKVGLVGKPSPATIFTPVRREDLQIWSHKIAAMGDPCIYVEGLVNNAS